jgi:hypothetical protein
MLRWLIINFVGDRAYLSRNKPIKIDELDFVLEGRKFEKPASWLLEVISYSEETAELFVKAIEYRCSTTPIPAKQEANSKFLEEVQKIKFKSLDTAGVLLTLAGKLEGKKYRPKQRSDFADFMEETSVEPTFEFESELESEPDLFLRNSQNVEESVTKIHIYTDQMPLDMVKTTFTQPA